MGRVLPTGWRYPVVPSHRHGAAETGSLLHREVARLHQPTLVLPWKIAPPHRIADRGGVRSSSIIRSSFRSISSRRRRISGRVSSEVMAQHKEGPTRRLGG